MANDTCVTLVPMSAGAELTTGSPVMPRREIPDVAGPTGV